MTRETFVNSSNIPTSPVYAVYTSYMSAIARACDRFEDFMLQHDNPCFKPMQQSFIFHMLLQQMNKDLRKHQGLFGKYGELIDVTLPDLANANRHVMLHFSQL